MRIVSAALLALFVASGAMAANKDADKPEKEKRVCRRETPTGSHLAVRTCHSKAEWIAIDNENKTLAQREVDRAQTMSTSDGSGYSAN